MTPLKLAVLISGRGSNLAAILAAIQAKTCNATVKIVISDREAPGIQIAQAAAIPTVTIQRSDFPTRRDHETKITEIIADYAVDLIVLAGYMQILCGPIFEQFGDKIINIHPSLLPEFKGLHAPRQALQAGVQQAGCTVHWVTPELDSGPIIAQASVPVYATDTETTLSNRILEQEHRLLPACIQTIAENRSTD